MYSLQTPLGEIILSWKNANITRVSLCSPGPSSQCHEKENPAPQWVIDTGAKILRFLQGHQDVNLGDIPLDFSACSLFYQEVYKTVRSLKNGEVDSYQGIAKRLGRPLAARAVGTAMAKNPFLLIVPCHRVVSENWKNHFKRGEFVFSCLTNAGGFSAPGGLATKIKLLNMEGLPIQNTTGLSRHNKGC